MPQIDVLLPAEKFGEADVNQITTKVGYALLIRPRNQAVRYVLTLRSVRLTANVTRVTILDPENALGGNVPYAIAQVFNGRDDIKIIKEDPDEG